MILQVVGFWFRSEEFVAIGERYADRKRAGLRRPVIRNAGEHVPADPERGRAVDRSFLDVRQGEPELGNGVPGESPHGHGEMITGGC